MILLRPYLSLAAFAILALSLAPGVSASIIETEESVEANELRGPVSYYGSNNVYSGNFQTSEDGNLRRGVLQFDLSGVEADILSANVSVRTNTSTTWTETISFYLLDQDVDTSSVTWEQYSSGNAWDTPGGDFDPGLVVSTTITKTSTLYGVWFDFDVRDLIQAAVDDERTVANLLMVADSETISWRSDSADTYPTLTTESQAIPEPASIALLG
ncbi:MAG: DNRLRE domain-containing protein, partial [Phycisphaeraceae bacterium]